MIILFLRQCHQQSDDDDDDDDDNGEGQENKMSNYK